MSSPSRGEGEVHPKVPGSLRSVPQRTSVGLGEKEAGIPRPGLARPVSTVRDLGHCHCCLERASQGSAGALQTRLNNPSPRSDSCGAQWGVRTLHSLGHRLGVNMRCSEEWGRLTNAPERSPKGPHPTLAAFRPVLAPAAGEQRAQALEPGQSHLVGSEETGTAWYDPLLASTWFLEPCLTLRSLAAIF